MADEAAAGDPWALVLDGSVTLTWSLADEGSEYAQSVFDALRAQRAVAPSIWLLEVANALLMAERRHRSTQAETAEIVEALRSLPITVEEATLERAFASILNLGRTHGLSSYDAAYLELAMRRGLPLATLDDRLIAVARAVGVSIYAAGPPRPESS